MRDCSELFRLGLRSEGFYFLMIDNKTFTALCRDGWTYFMISSQNNSIEDMNFMDGYYINSTGYHLDTNQYMLDDVLGNYFLGLRNLKRYSISSPDLVLYISRLINP